MKDKSVHQIESFGLHKPDEGQIVHQIESFGLHKPDEGQISVSDHNVFKEESSENLFSFRCFNA
jgi:hypothetical protein